MEEIKKAIRTIPDFPKKGILFYDITTLLKDGRKFKSAIDRLSSKFLNKKIDAVISIESRGFIIGSAIAYRLGAGIVPVRKKGKLPYKTYKATYKLEYGEDALEIHQDAIKPNSNVLIVDDLLATGGTVSAVIELIKKLKGRIVGIVFLIELSFLKGKEKLKGFDYFSLIQY
ncbi:MAG: adenine phosphoribosyltransferase [Candidatus Omnitrophica bacterium]|nr:adenine phosphoribosyltransferase [Candidatus Omnitrophota bacterium]